MSRLPRIQQLDCGSLNDFAIGAFRQIDRAHPAPAQNPHQAVGAAERASFGAFEVLRRRVQQPLRQETGSSGIEPKQRFEEVL